MQEIYQKYLGDVPALQGNEMTEEELGRTEFVKQRFMDMAQAKSQMDNKIQLIKDLYEVYEAHLTTGEEWNAPYRLPELFGAVQRKYADMLDNLPEARVRATRERSKDFAIVQQATLDSVERTGNAIREKGKAIFSAVLYGTGVLFEGYARVRRQISEVGDDMFTPSGKKVMRTLYDGLASESVDIRDFFIDETATVFYDETGIMGARDCCRRRIYAYSTFMERFKSFKNIDAVVPGAWDSGWAGFLKNPFPKESDEQKLMGKYVTVLEYWNVELDVVIIVANGIEVYSGANPFQHKRLPFALYYNYRRDDSVWGISEAEILAPFIYAKEELTNLAILDNKLALQPALAVSGDVLFNTEENELQPGAIFTLRGLNGGKVGDAITPLRFGDMPQSTFELLKKLDDLQIIATGDDINALYSSPDQLATQTLSKREVAQKRIRSLVVQNSTESERNRVQMRLSNVLQFYCKPYQNIEGRVVNRRIRIEGYQVLQENDETKPEFVQAYGAQSYFTLNSSSVGNMDGVEIEIVDAKLDEDLKKERMDDFLRLLELLSTVGPMSPQLLQDMDMGAFLREIIKELGLDTSEIFPMPAGETDEDDIDIELEMVRFGVKPPINEDNDPLRSLERYVRFVQTDKYREMPDMQKSLVQQLITETTAYVPTYLQKKLDEKRSATRRRSFAFSSGQRNMAATGQVPGQGGGESVPPVYGMDVPAGNAVSQGGDQATVSAPPGVAKRFGFTRGSR